MVWNALDELPYALLKNPRIVGRIFDVFVSGFEPTPKLKGFQTPESRGAELTEKQQERIKRLRNLGYVGAVSEARGSGVSLWDRDRALEGLNFAVQGHSPEAVLMDMQGKILHRWRLPFREAFPTTKERRRSS